MTGTGHNRIAFRLIGLVLFMLSMSFAAVPFYDWFCRVTGYGGTTDVAETGSDVVLEQTIQVRFDATVERGMPWTFKPVARTQTLRIGETGLAFYEAHNPTDVAVAGTASFNVTPYSAGEFFTKIDCFCFEMQVLQPGETVSMPVSYYIDPEILDHAEASRVKTITLSYTFHRADLPEEEAEEEDVTLNPAPLAAEQAQSDAG